MSARGGVCQQEAECVSKRWSVSARGGVCQQEVECKCRKSLAAIAVRLRAVMVDNPSRLVLSPFIMCVHCLNCCSVLV